MMCVIGSGPAGISAAYTLVKAGHKVIMLDVGRTLEPEMQAVVSRMAGIDKSAWDHADIERIRSRTIATASGVSPKYAYSSYFPYQDAEAGIKLVRRNAELLPSFAQGGLSNVWGAALLPYCKNDISDWPVTPDDLAPHYSALHEFMPLAAAKDDLDSDFPLYGDPDEVPPSRQCARLLQDIRGLGLSGVRSGRARLAVKHGCILCGMCLYGCPKGLIYNSSHTLLYLRSRPNFTYQAATTVHRLEESRGHVVIEAEQAGETVKISADYVFVAAGVLPSTGIILRSLAAFDRPVPVKNSQHFIFGLLRPCRTIGASTEELHTLSQAFLEVSEPKLSPFTIHMQCYTYNDLLPRAVQHALGKLSALVPQDRLFERLILVQGYLHSKHSPDMQLTLHRSGLYLAGTKSLQALPIVKGVMKKLRPLGVALFTDIGLPGRGFHAGGSLPMRRSPSSLETDKWGRVHGHERIHVVDASVFPSIPATTITYTAMANACRIAAEFGKAHRPTKRAMRCAITGANGFVGRALSDYLRHQGFEVIPLVRRPLGSGRLYSLESTLARNSLEGVDYLVHAAYDFSDRDKEYTRKINIEGSRSLFNAARDANVRHTVYISSLSAYTGCPSNYGRTKLAIEEIAKARGISIIRPGLVFGPEPGGMFGALKQLSSYPVIPQLGNGRQALYMAHHDDVGRLIAHLLSMDGWDQKQPIPAAHTEPILFKDIIGSFIPANKMILPLPGRFVQFALQTLEFLGYSSRMRSDSLITLLTAAPPPDFTPLTTTGVTFRPFLPS